MSSEKSQGQQRILIIDDDVSFRKILELRLRSFMPSMEPSFFGTLQEARQFLQSEPPPFDLVILDEHLPDGRGVELLGEGWFQDQAVLSVSSDDAPEIPGALLQAGAAYFLAKVSVSEPLFKPLVQGIIDRNKIQRELNHTRIHSAVIDTVRTLIGTLKHEINNPLGAVLGAAYLLRTQHEPNSEQQQAAELVESSGKRIKHVLDQLSDAVALESVTKAQQKVFQIPGDKPWGTDR